MASVTLAEIAARAGVSISTVSNVLNKRGGYGEETRNRILEVAEELGYFEQRRRQSSRPSRRALQTVLAVYCPFPASFSPDQVPANFEADVVSAIDHKVQASGYRLVVTGTSGDPDAPLPSPFRAPDVAGILLVGGRFPDAFVARLMENGLPLVMVGSFPRSLECDAVTAANRSGIYRAAEYLASRGRRAIAFIKGPPSTHTSFEKFLGYQEALQHAGLPIDPSLVFEGDFSAASGERVADAILEGKVQADAVLASTDTMAAACLRRLTAGGVKVPDDVAVFGFGDHSFAQYTQPALSTMRVPRVLIGELAASRLLEMIRERPTTHLQTHVSTEMVIRESAG